MADRRTFLKLLAAAAGAATHASPAIASQTSTPPAARASASIRKSTLISMLPRKLSYADRFALARETGFEAIEMQTINKEDEAVEIRDASKKSGLRIHSVMNSDHWRLPLSSTDAEVVSGSVKGMETSFRNAVMWGADAVLLVPAVVDATTSYRDAWTRSQRVIRERLLPMARDMKVTIAVEEVWNKFLLSPIEFARYVDDFESPWVRAYFDVGNVVLYGFPQDWIRTLGPRIGKRCAGGRDARHSDGPCASQSVRDWRNLRFCCRKPVRRVPTRDHARELRCCDVDRHDPDAVPRRERNPLGPDSRRDDLAPGAGTRRGPQRL